MSNIDSPAVARRRVRLALRAARLAKKLTQSQVARDMDWSLSKVIRIEKGEVNVSPSDLKLLLDHLGVTDPDRVRELIEEARLSRTERWTISAEEREHMTAAMIELIQFEADATAVRYYNNIVVPGPLQTPEYAKAVIAASSVDDLGPATIAARMALRERRRQRVHDSRGAEDLVLLDESVLLRPWGGSSVMAEQLKQLRAMCDESRVRLRVAPLSGPSASLFLGPFMLIDLENDRSALLYRETPAGDETVHDHHLVEQHRAGFDQMWQSSLDQDRSAELIRESTKRFAIEAKR